MTINDCNGRKVVLPEKIRCWMSAVERGRPCAEAEDVDDVAVCVLRMRMWMTWPSVRWE